MPASCMAPALMTAWMAVARNSGGNSATGRQLLHHADFHAPLGRAIELDVVHEVAHEKDAAAARLEDVLRRERVGHFSGLESLALIRDADDELGGSLDGRERKLDRHDLVGMLAVAVLDRVDDRLADGDADPVDGVFVEGGELSHSIAEDLHEVHHVEQARDL